MKTTFVTGGTGFIGSRLIALLVARDVEVRALARSQAGMEKVQALGAVPVQGDVTDPESLREAMRGKWKLSTWMGRELKLTFDWLNQKYNQSQR